MKIAREIADVFEPEMESAIDSLDRVLRPARTRENLEAIITAKLEPVRDAFAGLVGTAQRIAFEDAGLHNSDWQADPHDVLQLTLPEAIKALALFEEEE